MRQGDKSTSKVVKTRLEDGKSIIWKIKYHCEQNNSIFGSYVDSEDRANYGNFLGDMQCFLLRYVPSSQGDAMCIIITSLDMPFKKGSTVRRENAVLTSKNVRGHVFPPISTPAQTLYGV